MNHRVITSTIWVEAATGNYFCDSTNFVEGVKRGTITTWQLT